MSGLSPFAGECDVETMGNVTVGKYDFNDEAFDNVSAECIEFITKLLMKEHDKRLTAKEALRHKWVKKRPQYAPSSTIKAANSPLSLKPAYSNQVRMKFCKLRSAVRCALSCSHYVPSSLMKRALQINVSLSHHRRREESGIKFFS